MCSPIGAVVVGGGLGNAHRDFDGDRAIDSPHAITRRGGALDAGLWLVARCVAATISNGFTQIRVSARDEW